MLPHIRSYFVMSQGTLTEGEGSVQLTSLFRSLEQIIYSQRRSTVLSLPLKLVFTD